MSDAKNIVVFEPLCKRFEHAVFNAAFLLTLREAFPESKIFFWADSEHIKNVEDLLREEPGACVEYKPLNIPEANAPYIRKMRDEFLLCAKICRFASRKKAVLIASAASELVLVYLRILITIFYPRLRCVAVLHSLLKYLVRREDRGFREKIAERFIVPFALNFAACKKISNIVLSNSIWNALRQLDLKIFSYTNWINMPYLPSKKTFLRDDSPAARFGFAGLGTLEKGIDVFFKLAVDVAEHVRKNGGEAEFYFIGRLNRSCSGLHIPEAVRLVGNNARLSQDEYDAAVARCDCLIFPYRKEDYKMVASAVLTDAMKFRKYVISADIAGVNEYFSGMKERGKVCSNYEEMKKAAIDFIYMMKDKDFIKDMENMIEIGAESHLPKNEAFRLKWIVERVING